MRWRNERYATAAVFPLYLVLVVLCICASVSVVSCTVGIVKGDTNCASR